MCALRGAERRRHDNWREKKVMRAKSSDLPLDTFALNKAIAPFERMEKGPGPEVYTYPELTTNPAPATADAQWRLLVLIGSCALIIVAIFYFAYALCLKDLVLLWRAKRSRTVTELGFGNTPARQAGEGV